MKKLLILIVVFIVFCSHDMFLKMGGFFLDPDQPVSLHLYNGTFDKSENVITRDRMIDVSIVGNGSRQQLDTSMWTEEGHITVLNFQSGMSGTWVAGVSTGSRNIELSAEDFNGYLEHDGILDMIEQRKRDGTVDEPAVEKYSKHVKAVFQVGEEKSDDWKVPLGYPIEFVPQNNPYELEVGDMLQLKLLRAGQPLPEQLVYSGFARGGHSHANDEEADGTDEQAHHHDEQQTRTDANGLLDVKIDHGGQWYVRTIHMVTSAEPGLTHESNWATLTFEIAGGLHGHPGISNVVYWAVGLFLILAFSIYLRKRRSVK